MTQGTQDIIPLGTIKGLIGYKITKFQIMPFNFNETDEWTIQVWKTDQTGAIDNVQDFSDNRLLAVAYLESDATDTDIGQANVIFDNEKFNQDIYVTFKSSAGTPCNYYLELEQMTLDLNEQTVATLKDIRNTGTQ